MPVGVEFSVDEHHSGSWSALSRRRIAICGLQVAYLRPTEPSHVLAAPFVHLVVLSRDRWSGSSDGLTIGDSDSYVTRRRWPCLSIIGASYSAVGCSIRIIGDVEARPFKGASAFMSADPDGEF
jgi:hypothetical protein